MTFTRFVLKNSLRNKKRLGFTVLSIGFSLFLLIALFTMMELLINPPQSDASILRLVVSRSTALSETMPVAYDQKIKSIPHVALTMPFQWFGGYWKEPKNFFANLAGDPVKFWEMFPEIKVSNETKQAFKNEKMGAVVGTGLMQRYGWKIGDRITLTSAIYSITLDMIVVGTYEFPLNPNNLYFRFDYLNEAMGDKGLVGAIWVKADSTESIPGLMQAIDNTFHNTAAETKTETEKSFQLSFTSMLGNVRAMIGSIALVVVFSLLLVTASTMAMTIRERTREVAILKAIGYGRGIILGLILGEAVIIASLGMLFAWLLCVGLNSIDVYSITKGFLPSFLPPKQVYTGALVTAIGVGLLSGLIPALQASNMKITTAMRHLD